MLTAGPTVRHGSTGQRRRPRDRRLRGQHGRVHGGRAQHLDRVSLRLLAGDGLHRVGRRHSRGRAHGPHGRDDGHLLLHLRLLRAHLRVHPALGDGQRAHPRRLHDDARRRRHQLAVPRRRRAGLRHHRRHALHLQHLLRPHRRHPPLHPHQHPRLAHRPRLRRPHRAPQQVREGPLELAHPRRLPAALDGPRRAREAGLLARRVLRRRGAYLVRGREARRQGELVGLHPGETDR